MQSPLPFQSGILRSGTATNQGGMKCRGVGVISYSTGARWLRRVGSPPQYPIARLCLPDLHNMYRITLRVKLRLQVPAAIRQPVPHYCEGTRYGNRTHLGLPKPWTARTPPLAGPIPCGDPVAARRKLVQCTRELFVKITPRYGGGAPHLKPPGSTKARRKPGTRALN